MPSLRSQAGWSFALRAIALFAATALHNPLLAQGETGILDTEQAPPHVRWLSLQTPHFQVVFPSAFQSEAQRVAVALERLHSPLGGTMGGAPRPVTVVLHTQSTTANGYVALAPRRTVWYATPPHYGGLLGTMDWLTLLATHETRHVAQNDHANAGFTRLAGTIFGDVGQTLTAHLAIPSWMWEGDAVGTETALSAGGRGRMPEFDKEMRALALAGRLPPYRQALNGSLAEYFPNHYPLGFALTTYLRRTRGPEVVAKLFRRTAATAYNPLAFEAALARETGLSAPALYDSAMRDLTGMWRAQAAAITVTEARRVTRPAAVWTSYQHPQYLDDGTIVAVKYGLADAPVLVRLDSSGAETLLRPVAANSGLRAAGSRVVWAEGVPDPRWGLRDFSVVRVHDVSTGLTRSLTRRSRLFAPALDPAGERIAALEVSTMSHSAVVVLDAATGREGARFAAPRGTLLREVSWSDDGLALVLTIQDLDGKSLGMVDPATGEFRELTPRSHMDVSRPAMHRGRVFFTSPYSGIDNVYMLDTATGRRYQVTSRPVGAYQPAVSGDGRTLLFADYTADGYTIVEAALDSSSWVPVDEVVVRPIDYAAPLVAQEGAGNIAPVADSLADPYPVRRYGMGHLFNVHSWSPILGPGEVGAMAFSTNVLNTLGAQLGYRYNRIEGAGAVDAVLSYAGWYPIVDLGLQYGARASTYEVDDESSTYTWRERAAFAGLRLPLDFSRGAQARTIALETSAAATHVSGLDVVRLHRNNNGDFVPLTHTVRAANARRRAPRDIRSPWAQQGWVTLSHTPFGGDYRGTRLGAFATADFPGLRRHHGLRLDVGMERQADDSYRFPTELRAARGFDLVYRDTRMRGSAEYRFPVAYPDLALGPVLYTPRLQGAAFYDHSVGSGSGPFLRQQSLGVELTADATLFSWEIFPLALGVRYVHRIGQGARLEPIIDLSF